MILKDQDTAQSFQFIGRELYTNSTTKLVFTDLTLSTDYTYTSVTVANDRYFNTISHAMTDLLEGRFYRLEIYKTGAATDPVFIDKVFVTNQTLTNGNYTINDGVYTERTTDNDYITI